LELLTYLESKSAAQAEAQTEASPYREVSEAEAEEKFNWAASKNEIFDKSPFYNTGDGISERMRADILWAEQMKLKMKAS